MRIVDSTLAKHIENRLDNPPPMPTWSPEDEEGPLPEEVFHEDIHQFTDSSISFQSEVKK